MFASSVRVFFLHAMSVSDFLPGPPPPMYLVHTDEAAELTQLGRINSKPCFFSRSELAADGSSTLLPLDAKGTYVLSSGRG